MFKRMLFFLLLVLPCATPAQNIHFTRKLSGAAQGGFFRPTRIALLPDPPANLTKAPALTAPLFGTIQIGPKEEPSSFLVAFDTPPGEKSRLYVDANGNGDLTDDPTVEWKPLPYKDGQNKEWTRHEGVATIQVRYGKETLPVKLVVFAYDPQDPARALYKNSLLAYIDTGTAGELTLGDKTYKALLTDILGIGDFRGAAEGGITGIYLMIDVNGNGSFDRQGESFDIGQPFNIKGTTYEISGMTADGLSFRVEKSKKTVPEIPPPPDLRVGQKALPFEAKTLDGKTVRFPEDFKGHLVFLHFWASWCSDCRMELPGMVKTVTALQGEGLMPLGVSLDVKEAAESLPAFLRTQGIVWPQIYDGQKWKAAIAQLYFIHEIPGAYLLDGDTGEVVASEKDLLGEKLEETLKKALAKKKQK